MVRFSIVLLLVTLLAGESCKHEPVTNLTEGITPPVQGAPEICFESHVLPIFVSNCAKSGCHDAASHRENVRTYDYAGIRKGFTPNNPYESKYWEVIMSGEMPPDAPLTKAQKDSIYKWIVQGAKNTTNCASSCDLSATNYSSVIVPILESSCYGCHNANNQSAGLNLKDYNVVKTIALNGRLMGSVNHEAGYSPMPVGGKLSDCQIQQLDKWIQAGALNN
ncbi:MAG: hypothetical protein KGP35_05530 [Bacteroidetes bacterium]|nr:hypothetical protein [Bacteroidota bacterium]